MWFTITVPNAPKGQGEFSSARAELALRIQCARVENGIVSSYGSGEADVRWMRKERIREIIESG